MLLHCHNSLTQKEFKRLSNAVYDHCGINLHEGKKDLVDARLGKLLRKTNFHSIGEYVDYAVEHPNEGEFYTLIDALCTNVTNFFREIGHFDFLEKNFLPALLEKKGSQRQARIRGWSAACSSGEEAYSIAMTLLNAIPKPTSMNVKLLATDISHNMLTKAYQAEYASAQVSTVPALFRKQFLTTSSHAGEIVYSPIDAVRNIVQFAYLNLIESWPFNGPFDFIFCRNVMIYFDKATQQKLVKRFYDVLGEGGMLFIGHSESLAGISHKFRYVRPTIYAKD